MYLINADKVVNALKIETLASFQLSTHIRERSLDYIKLGIVQGGVFISGILWQG